MSNDPAALLNMVQPNKSKSENMLHELVARSQEAGEWHNCLLIFTTQLVEACFCDEEIHWRIDQLTTYGFTVPKTRAEVKKMINGALDKVYLFILAQFLKTTFGQALQT